MKLARAAAILSFVAPILLAQAPAFAQGETKNPPAPNASSTEPQPPGSLPVAVPKKPATRHVVRAKSHRAATHS